jgi:flagellar capping protein FliD
VVLEKFNKHHSEIEIFQQHLQESQVLIEKLQERIKHRNTNRLQQSYEFFERELRLYTEISSSLSRAYHSLRQRLSQTETYARMCQRAKQNIEKYVDVNITHDLTGE